jgi:FdhE protein
LNAFAERAARARVLAERYAASSEILTFYAGLADWQAIQAGGVSGFGDLAARLPSLVDLAVRTGPPVLGEAGTGLLGNDPGPLLLEYWEAPGSPSGVEFFVRTLLQLYATQLEEGQDCPWCRQAPQAGCFITQGDGQAFHLVCALCFRRRPFMRAKCPSCGETGERKLVTYATDEFAHLRLKACDSCKAFLLAVDLEKESDAIPEVDELAGLPLALWGVDTGYHKVRLNMVGL